MQNIAPPLPKTELSTVNVDKRPVPESNKANGGLMASLLVTSNDALFVPILVGVNNTLNVQLEPIFRGGKSVVQGNEPPATY